MRIFSAVMADRTTSGFSLVELLVALAVMGLLASVVILSLPGEEAALRSETSRLAARVAAIRDQAIVTARPTAVWISPSGYGFEERRDGDWRAADGRGFEPHDWPDGTAATINDRSIPVRIVFDPLGTTVSPVEISLQAAEAATIVHLAASGELKIDE
jgi:general secretion pathway protein H